MFLLHASKEQHRKENSNQKEANKSCFAFDQFALSSSSSSNIWYIDSGATSHMTGDIHDYIADSYLKTNLGSVTYGDGSKGQIIGTGSVMLQNGIILHDVLHVLGIKSKLISLKCLVNSGRKIILTQHGGTFIDNAYNKYKIESTGNLFHFSGETRCMFAKPNYNDEDNEKLLEAHRVLGHISEKALRKIFPKLSGRIVFCIVCAKAKMRSKPYKRGSDKHAKAILQNLHSDMKGPLPSGWNGEHYIIIIIDEFSRYILIELLESKADASKAIKGMITTLESICKLESKTRREVSGTVLNFKTDGGGEYVSTDLQEWCQQKGISHLQNSPYSPSTNGLAEKVLQSVMGKTKCILLESGLNISLWPYAVLHSTFLYNITPHSALDFKSPFEVLFNKKYDSYDNLMKFGTYCVAHKGGEILYKRPFESTGFDGIYLGTDFKTGLHIVLNLQTFQVHPRIRTLNNSGNFVPKETLEEFGLDRGESEYDKYIPGPKDEDFNPNDYDDMSESDNEIERSKKKRKKETYDESLQSKKAIKRTQIENTDIDCEEQSNCEEQFNCEEQSKNSDHLKISEYTTKDKIKLDCEEQSYCEEQSKNSAGNLKKGLERPSRKAKLNEIADIEELLKQQALIHKIEDEDLNYNLCKDDPKWVESMNEEITSLTENKTWTLVPRPKNQKILKSKWVYKLKTDLDGNIIRYKSRLVVQGFRQNFLEDYIDTFSSVLHKSSFRCFLSIATSKGYKLRHIDIDTAFLNADIEEGVEIYIEQPEGFVDPENPDHVCLLQKSLYGIKQAPRLWEDHISSYLQNTLKLRPTSDPCILINDYCVIAIYVDDIIIAAETDDKTSEIFSIIKNQYKCKDLGKLHSYIGFEITYDESDIFLTQRNYIDKMLKVYNLENCVPAETPFKNTLHTVKLWNKETHAPYRSAIGALLYLSNGTRPDIAFVVSMLARYVDKPTQEAWECVKHVFRYLKGTKNFCLKYSSKNSKDYVHEITAYSDSDWAGDKITRRSTSGSLIFHNGNLVDWTSKLQKCVSLSSCEAEIIAMSHTAQDIIWIKRVVSDLQNSKAQESYSFLETPVIYADNQSALKVARDPQHFGRMKHVELRDLFVREKVNDGTLLVEYVPSKENLADLLTKATSRLIFFKLRDKLCLVNNKN
jgi:hypothetical protein